jgi:hypothetical protein
MENFSVIFSDRKHEVILMGSDRESIEFIEENMLIVDFNGFNSGIIGERNSQFIVLLMHVKIAKQEQTTQEDMNFTHRVPVI